jgi:hypothetical protein
MTTTMTRRSVGASEQSRGMLANSDSGAIDGAAMQERALAALRELMVGRVQRSCGGFSCDDIGWQMRVVDPVDAVIEALEERGLVRFTGWDDADEVSCYALVTQEVVGMAQGATRYGRLQLVALECVGTPVRRERPEAEAVLWDRYLRLVALTAWFSVRGEPVLAAAVHGRAQRVLRVIAEGRRRFMEGYVRDGVGAGWCCTSMVEGRAAA